MLQAAIEDGSIEQLINITTLPGIYKYAIAMPDIHHGYGFPIGGVAALSMEDGVVSPGGVGYDINCGVRLIATPHSYDEIKDKLPTLINKFYQMIPTGLDCRSNLRISSRDLDDILNQGMKWTVKKGYAQKSDLDAIEEYGSYQIANAESVSDHAKKRGYKQVGTLGSGNHFVEITKVVKIYDEEIARKFDLFENQVNVMIHCGSRGLGHQVCTDYVRLIQKNIGKFGIRLPDKHLACAPLKSEEGERYLQAMAAAANYAWVNRQMITYEVRNILNHLLNTKPYDIEIIYDVAHNIAKLENYDGKKFIVHRKGAARAFGPGHPELPKQYQETGQPVLIPGSMGTASYVLAGLTTSEASFCSACHGAGRRLSRSKAKRTLNYQQLIDDLTAKNILVRGSTKGLIEEAPAAYKDIDSVVEVTEKANIAKKIVKLKPLAVIKG
jgi:tRNA-splicing ligase RtcB